MVPPRLVEPLIAIVGPTASGKSALALDLAEELGGEIINADSRQFYRELVIGTAKPSESELARVSHHLIDCASINAPWDAGLFVKNARAAINDVRARNKTPIVVGGTGMYLNHLIYGLAEVPEIPQTLREELQNRLLEEGLSVLYDELGRRDPEAYRRLKSSDTQRILRHLEVVLRTDKPLSAFWPEKKTPLYDHTMIGLSPERELLYQRIDERVLNMMKMGLENEVHQLWALHPKNPILKKTIGYAEWDKFKDADQTRIVSEIQTNSRHFAKRQLTWFRREKAVRWIEVTDLEKQKHTACNILKGHL
jgi:tRNA dimethylallyltransferase